ncbi:MAG: metal-dependent transcriptional regulator [Anaerolineaceae bacterium]|nr:MAG: metal-dependent transcriptional regulator [Anaerolineaceae bacterium]
MAELRDYLARIYSLSDLQAKPDDYVSTSALADAMGVTAPAVNRMVTKLKENGYLHHEPYQGIKLTDAGRREALGKLRYQRIAAAFLVTVMGFGWHEIEEESSRMSGALSELIAGRMLAMAGNPTRDPFGEPIPAVDRTVPPADDTALASAEDGQQAIITRIKTRESDRLEYLAALGLWPDASITIIHKAPFNGPMQLKLAEEYRIIGHNLAELICVRPLT